MKIGFDAQPENCPGAQWITIRHSDAATGTPLPRDLMQEQVVKVGSVKRQLSVEPDPSFPERRCIGLSLAENSPYSLIRSTRMQDGSIQDEEIFPFPPEPKKPEPIPLF